MTRVAVLRPEPGNAATSRRLALVGLESVRIPLFRVVPVAWDVPDVASYSALVLTSANAVRHAGPLLSRLAALPVRAVGPATAGAARAAGLAVRHVGTAGAADIPADGRLLHLAGRDHLPFPGADTIIVYDSVPLDADLSALAGTITLVHSPRAGSRLAGLVQDRAAVRIAAISMPAAVAAGDGWRSVDVAASPDDSALVALARRLAD